ncbi:MAG TPA: 50S ribosomal protein L3 N(5)-glutamine methyltransferase [Burkholderiaceae bacterium]|nr:50S ribosomal protein L3 N(5)-glutamine methyltransferase [Burkholderiaceae bacterium]
MTDLRFRRPAPSADDARAALRTVRDLLRWATGRMRAAGVAFGHGTDDAWDEAAWLVLWSLHLPPDRLEPVLDARLAPAEIAAAVALVERRCTERLPAAYLTGEAWLRGVRFLSDPRALVPRSPIAELIDGDALDPWLPADGPAHVMDLCTGGASLAILAALRWPDAAVVGTDLSADALALAAENVALHELEARVSLRRGSLWAPVAGERFDLVVCNPPYVNAASMAALPAEYLHEPQGALGGGDDGMDLVRDIVAGARGHLAPGGVLVLEIGHEAAHFEAAFAGLEFGWLPVESGDDRIVLLERDALP